MFHNRRLVAEKWKLPRMHEWDLLKVPVSKVNGIVAFGHLLLLRSALLSLEWDSFSSSSFLDVSVSECLVLRECDKCSRVDDDITDIVSAVSWEIVPGGQRKVVSHKIFSREIFVI